MCRGFHWTRKKLLTRHITLGSRLNIKEWTRLILKLCHNWLTSNIDKCWLAKLRGVSILYNRGFLFGNLPRVGQGFMWTTFGGNGRIHNQRHQKRIKSRCNYQFHNRINIGCNHFPWFGFEFGFTNRSAFGRWCISSRRKKRKKKNGKSRFNHSTGLYGRSLCFHSLSFRLILRPNYFKWTSKRDFGIGLGKYGANLGDQTSLLSGFGMTDIPLKHGETRLHLYHFRRLFSRGR